MKIRHFSFSSGGGAGRVAKNLQIAQSKLGHDAKLIFKVNGALKSEIFREPDLVMRSLLDNKIVSKKQNVSLFSHFRKSPNLPSEIRFNQINHFHWTPGLVDLEQLIKSDFLRIPMIWTLHDMWPFTGGCHYSLGCTNFRSSCEKCPQVKKVFSKIPRDSLLLKSKFFELNKKNLILVAPSEWIAGLARTSIATKHLQIVQIPNPVNLDVFKPKQIESGSDRTQHSNYDLIIGCGSMNLNDPIKGVESVLKAAEETSRITRKRIKVIAVGTGGFPNFKNTDNLDIQYTGLLNQEEMAKFFSQIDLFLHMAKEENYPNVLLESLASGVPIICLKSGGMEQIVEQSESGYVIDHEKGLIHLLSQLTHDLRPLQIKGIAGRLYSVNNLSGEVIARKYIELYSELFKSLNKMQL